MFYLVSREIYIVPTCWGAKRNSPLYLDRNAQSSISLPYTCAPASMSFLSDVCQILRKTLNTLYLLFIITYTWSSFLDPLTDKIHSSVKLISWFKCGRLMLFILVLCSLLRGVHFICKMLRKFLYYFFYATCCHSDRLFAVFYMKFSGDFLVLTGKQKLS
jgi:hypothetical protein